MTDADAAFRPVPTYTEPVGAPENGGRLRCPDHPDRPDTQHGEVAENGRERSVIRDWLDRLPLMRPREPVPASPEVVAARAAWLLQWVEEAWAAWQTPGLKLEEKANGVQQDQADTHPGLMPTTVMEQSR